MIPSDVFERAIDDIVAALKRGKDRPRKCCILIGAGCSVEAGIPSADGIVAYMRNNDKYRSAYDKAEEKTYAKCMANLLDNDRQDFIDSFVAKATVTLGYLALAHIIRAGYIDRVLTVNFDRLVDRACVLSSVPSAVYDMATKQPYSIRQVPGVAIYHLHGQFGGPVQLSKKEECEDHFEPLRPLMEDSLKDRVWIVVGYSGRDPVFRHLEKNNRFERGLFWVGYLEEEPPKHVRNLLAHGSDAWYVRGFDAERIFSTLAEKLGCAPCSETIASNAFINGIQFQTQANTKNGEEADQLLAKACNEYTKALSIFKRDVHTALQNLATVLSGRAKLRSGKEADSLFDQALKACADVVADEPKSSHALAIWGAVLFEQAKRKSGDKKLMLLGEKKLLQAGRIRPGAGAYNLACIKAIRGNHRGCRHWLDVASEHGTLPPRDWLEKDPELSKLRNKRWFLSFCEKVGTARQKILS